MVASFDHLYLMLQGEWRRRDNDGVLEEHRRNHKTGGSYWASASHGAREILWRDFESWLCSVTILSGMRLLRVQTWEEGAQYLKLLHSWYQKESHRSHQVLAQAKEVHVDHALLVKPPLARRVAAQLPGIGFSRSAAVAARFKTVVEMANAPEEAWTELVADDKRLGVRGKTIFRALRGGNGG
jgi:ERCC4-type nuclease